MSIPTYLSQPVSVLSLPTAVGSGIAGTTYAVAPAGVPSGAMEIIAELQALTDNVNSVGTPMLQVRRDRSMPWMTLAFGVTSASGYGSAGGGVFRIPLSSSGTFDYQVTAPGFNNVLNLSIVGYVK